MNVAELLLIPASMFPDQEIVRFDGRGVSYGALQERVAHTAGALQALGVRPGDHVASLETNSPRVLESLYATLSLGAVFVPLNYRARGEELTHLLQVSAPKLLLVGSRYRETAEKALSQFGSPTRLVLLEDAAADGLPRAGDSIARLQTLVGSADPVEPAEVAEDQLAVLLFTSGTTANAKAVMLAHADLVSFVLSTTECADGSDRGSVLLAAPLHHIAGLGAVLAATFTGRRMVLMPQFEAEEWLRLVERERVTHAFLVPTMLKRVLDHPTFRTTDLSSLEVLSYGAAPMPLSVIRRALEAFPSSVQFFNAFGQTETTSTVTQLGPEDHRLLGSAKEIEKKLRRLGSIGRPLPDVELRILGEDGNPLPADQVGEIAIRSERTMRGYYGQEQATDETLRDGWLRTRDLGWIDEDGYVFLAGRKSDLIIRGGENIAPQEVEVVLESHPSVDEAAVFGVPDEEWGERVAAAVVLRPGAEASAEEIIEFCRQRLASFKKPEMVFFQDVLPRNMLGKVLKQELRAGYGGVLANGGVHAESNR